MQFLFDHWMEQVRKVTALDFDILVGGHGPVGGGGFGRCAEEDGGC